MTSILLLLSLATAAFASDDKTDRASLRGIKAVCLVVEVTDQGQGAVVDRVNNPPRSANR